MLSANAPSRIGVLLVDDEEMVRSGLAMILAAEPDVVVLGEAADGNAAVELALALRPHVVVMDIRMPGTDGVAATRTLTSMRSLDGVGDRIAVLVLTGFNDDDAVRAALRAGASGFVLKSSTPRALGEAVRCLADGGGWLDPLVTPALLFEFAHRTDPDRPPPERLRLLTHREREVLIALAHGLCTREVAAHLFVNEATVKTHLHRIFFKLGVSDRAQAVTLAYKTGLVKPDDRL